MIDYTVQIIPHFTLEEAMCKCGCGLVILQRELLTLQHFVRARYNKPIRIHSWTRCARHNSEIGGVAKSYHLYGKAVDMSPLNEAITPGFVNICEEYYPYVAVYEWGCHCDIRGRRSL